MTDTTDTTDRVEAQIDPDRIRHEIATDGITACKGAFPKEWVAELAQDIETAYQEARSRPHGAIGRGPNRWYVEVHPEAIRGFADIIGHPWVQAVCDSVLGPDWHVVEVGFDIPFPGAKRQPWHRDFPAPRETVDERRFTSLAFNITTVDTTEEMGPFEIALGTQYDDSPEFDHGMFPPKEFYPRYEERAVKKYPKVGDISGRSALTIHRGTENRSQSSRPVLVVGMDGPEGTNSEHHDMAVTQPYLDSLPAAVRNRLRCPVVDQLQPIEQKHDIEGLVMGEE
jgi:ectoine hydroxylase-related dioxygenase (phytanoyl-CoA dioxygenase family)